MSERDPTDVDDLDRAADQKARTNQHTQKVEVEDTRWLMANKRGRRVVWRMLSRAGVFNLTFNTNAMTMAFAEGRRSEGLAVLAQIMAHCPDLYFEMTRENTNEKT